MTRGWVLAVFALTISSAAQAQASRSGRAAGACAEANWVCVAECIDRRCANKCLEGSCADPLAALRQCTVDSACPSDDPDCAGERCGGLCTKAFGRAREPQAAEVTDPCANVHGGKVPEELVGGWNLRAASIEVLDRRPGADPAPQPRADYEMVLEVKPNGCFVLSGKLEDETLGQGNLLVVRGWGKVTVEEKKKPKRLRLETLSGQAVGQVCGKPRVADLSGGKFRGPTYSYAVEAGVLTLTMLDADKQTFQFEKGAPKQLEESP